MTNFSPSRQPRPETLGEFADYNELLRAAGAQVIELDDALDHAHARVAAREARRRGNAVTPDQVGRGRG